MKTLKAEVFLCWMTTDYEDLIVINLIDDGI